MSDNELRWTTRDAYEYVVDLYKRQGLGFPEHLRNVRVFETMEEMVRDPEVIQHVENHPSWKKYRSGSAQISLSSQDLDQLQADLAELPTSNRQLGMYLIGLSGAGKSTLMEHLIVDDLQHNNGFAVLDPHGQLVDNLLGFVPYAESAIVLDPAERERPFALNLFACEDPDDAEEVTQVVEGVMHTFRRVWGVGQDRSWGPRLENVLRHASYTLVANQDTHLGDLPRLLLDEDYRRRLAGNVENEATSYFWQRYDALDRRQRNEWIDPVLNKVEAFLVSPYVAPIVTSSETSIDFYDVVDDGYYLFAPLRRGQIGDEAVSLLGTAILTKLMAAAMQRGGGDTFTLYLDEFHRFTPEGLDDLFDEFRKYNLGAVVAHQRRSQLPAPIRDAPLGAGTVVIFQVNPNDARDLSGLFDATPETIVTGERPEYGIAQDPWRELENGRGKDNRDVYTAYYKVKKIILDFEWHAEWVSAFDPWMEYGNQSRYEPQMEHVREAVRTVEEAVAGYLQARRYPKEPGKLDIAFDTLSAVMEVIEFDRIPSYVGKSGWGIDQKGNRSRKIANQMWDALKELADLLDEYPIMTQTGRTIPIEDKRPVVDIANEIANELVHLAPYTARIKERFSGRQETVELPPPLDRPAGFHTRAEAVREYSRAEYGRERSRRNRIEIEEVEPIEELGEELPDDENDIVRRDERLT